MSENEDLHVKRSNVFFQIIQYRNDNSEQGAAAIVYDCEELGLCRVYWRTGWECEWLHVEKLPFKIVEPITVINEGFVDKWIEAKKKLRPVENWSK